MFATVYQNSLFLNHAQNFAKDILLLTQFLMKKGGLKSKHPKQVKWIESLTHKEIIELMKAVHKKHPSMVGNDSFDFIPELIIHAIELGITANLSLEKVHIKDKDLRALNLKGVNLNEAIFENCQLPLAGRHSQCKKVKIIKCSLAGIDENTSLGAASKFFLTLSGSSSPPSAIATQYFIQYLQSNGLQKKDIFGYTALTLASAYGHTECVKAILESKHCSKELLEVTDNDGYTALSWAARNGHIELFKAILDSEHCTVSLLEMTDNDGNTALHRAVNEGDAECVKAILENQHCSAILLEMANEYGKSALHLASTDGHTDCVKAILESEYCSKELLELTDKYGKSALHWAIIYGYTDCVKATLENEHCSATLLEMPDTGGCTTLTLAARNGQIECVKAILGSKHWSAALMEKANKEGSTALSLAVRNGHITCVKAILESEYCSETLLKMANKDGNNALTLAAHYGKSECVKAILKSKHCSATLLKRADKSGDTALAWAALSGRTDCVEVILESRHCSAALLETANKNGNTALAWAVLNGHTECVKAILESAHCTLAMIKKLNTKGQCAAQVARDKHPSIAQEIRRYTTYLEAWENKSSLIAKITALLTEYCKEKPPILAQHSLFNTDSALGKEHSQVVSALLDNYQEDKIDTNTLLNHLRELSNKSVEHPLSRYIKFIESRLSTPDSDGLAVNTEPQASIKSNSTINEQLINRSF